MEKIIFVALLALASSFSFASDYPPGYEITTECQTQGPLKVCAINRTFSSGYSRIRITYTGFLMTPTESQNLNLYARSKATGRTVILPLKTSTITLANVSAYRCLARPFGTDPQLKMPVLNQQYQYCKIQTQSHPTSSSLLWEVDPIPQDETDFVQDIFSHSLGNFEIAIFNEMGQWDSNYGLNYSF